MLLMKRILITYSSSNPLMILEEVDEGGSFRFLTCSVVMVGAAQAMDIPAQLVGLKNRTGKAASNCLAY